MSCGVRRTPTEQCACRHSAHMHHVLHLRHTYASSLPVLFKNHKLNRDLLGEPAPAHTFGQIFLLFNRN